jgi:uracil-DNA glycosylase family 4
MSGFFSHEELNRGVTTRRKTLQRCGGCKLKASATVPNWPASGGGERGLLVISDSVPDTSYGSKEYRLLESEFGRLGIDLARDARHHYAVTCPTPGDRKPTPIEVDSCRPALYKELKENPPRLIIPSGPAAVRSLLGEKVGTEITSVHSWRGWTIPDQEWGAWVCPVYRPRTLMGKKPPPAVEPIFRADLARAVELLDTPILRHPPFSDCVWVTEDEDEAIEYIQGLLRDPPPVAAVDFETTGLKPQSPGHRIVCASIADSPFTSGAFPVTERVKRHLGMFMESSIPKIAANIPFEDAWTGEILKARAIQWFWDCVLSSHVLDNRRGGINSVKYQAMVRFGVGDYSSHISPYLKAKDEQNGNAFNRIHKVEMKSLLRYCAIDSLVEYWIANLHMELLGKGSIWTWW